MDTIAIRGTVRKARAYVNSIAQARGNGSDAMDVVREMDGVLDDLLQAMEAPDLSVSCKNCGADICTVDMDGITHNNAVHMCDECYPDACAIDDTPEKTPWERDVYDFLQLIHGTFRTNDPRYFSLVALLERYTGLAK